jgi:hydroxyacylglutathione hydrolase
MKTIVIPVTIFDQNCTLLWCTQTMLGAFVDPGGDIDQLISVAKENNVTIEKILITHGHLDHAGGAAELAERLSVPIEGPHKDDDFWIQQLPEQTNGGYKTPTKSESVILISMSSTAPVIPRATLFFINLTSTWP